MTIFARAALAGYSVDQVLRFLSLHYPAFKNFIQEATNQGYDEKQISEFIDRSMQGSLSNVNINEYKIRNLKKKLREEQIKRYGKAALNLATPFAVASIAELLSNPNQQAPQGAGQPPTQPPTQPQPMPSGGMPPVPAPMPGGGMPPVPITGGGAVSGMPPQAPMGGPQVQPTQPQGQLGPQGPKPSILKQSTFGQRFIKEQKALQAASIISKDMEPYLSMTDERIKKTFGLDDEELRLTKAYLESLTSKKQPQPQPQQTIPTSTIEEPTTPLQANVSQETPQVSREALKQFEVPTKAPIEPSVEAPTIEFPKLDVTKIKKGDEVITPNNEIGNIEAFSGSGVLVNVDGKIKKLRVDELEGTPDFIKSAKIVIDPSQVEEAAKSAALGTVLESPDKTKLSISFGPSGEFYTYRRKDGKPIDEDILNRIKEGMTMPISTGDAFLGSWDSGIADSRGTVAINDIVKFAQKEGEPDDPSKPLVYYKENTTYIHPYIKEMLNALMGLSKQYEKSKRKPKNTKTKSKPRR